MIRQDVLLLLYLFPISTNDFSLQTLVRNVHHVFCTFFLFVAVWFLDGAVLNHNIFMDTYISLYKMFI